MTIAPSCTCRLASLSETRWALSGSGIITITSRAGTSETLRTTASSETSRPKYCSPGERTCMSISGFISVSGLEPERSPRRSPSPMARP